MKLLKDIMKNQLSENASVLIIGNEILSGRTIDKNFNFIASKLNEHGISISESRTVSDNEQEIINAINELRKKYNYVFTTGGIGPTHDDVTAESISKAFNVELEINEEAYKILEDYYKELGSEFNDVRQRMARIPKGASLIKNDISAAPGFNIENVFSLPGVPSILKSMLGGLKNKIVGGAPIISHTINLRTVESEIAKSLTQVQNNNQDVEIGSYPFFRAGKLGVSIVVRSTDKDKIDTCNNEILKFVEEQKIQIVNEV